MSVEDVIYEFHSRDEAVNGAMEVAKDLGASADIYFAHEGARELVWTSDPVKLLRDMHRIWLAAGRRPG